MFHQLTVSSPFSSQSYLHDPSFQVPFRFATPTFLFNPVYRIPFKILTGVTTRTVPSFTLQQSSPLCSTTRRPSSPP